MQEQVDYLEAIRTKYPEQVVIVVARDRNGRVNPITLGWTMITSAEPPMMAIAVARSRYSIEVIDHAGGFTIAFPSAQMDQAALFYGSHSGRECDKFAECPAPTAPTRNIDSVILTEAVANFECTLETRVETGDHVLYVGRVVAAYKNSEPTKRLYTIGPDSVLGSVG
jgi:flavin reductase (DIM6/NTAB) family NADH-FMN oxidoreductase RutF